MKDHDGYTTEGKDSIPMSPTKPAATLSPRSPHRPTPLTLIPHKADSLGYREPSSPQKVYVYDASTDAFNARDIVGPYSSDLEAGQYPASPTSTIFETAGFIPAWEPQNKDGSAASFITMADTATLADTVMSPRSDTASTFSFDFDALPSKHTLASVQAKRSKMREIFSPLTKVYSPVVSRAQWHIVVRSSAWAMLFALTVTGACLAIPVQGGKNGVMF